MEEKVRMRYNPNGLSGERPARIQLMVGCDYWREQVRTCQNY